MKDVPHHLNKFLKQMAKEESNEGQEQLKKNQKVPPSKKQIKKQKKQKIKEQKEKQENPHPTIADQNKKMKKRTPVFRKRAHKTKQK